MTFTWRVIEFSSASDCFPISPGTPTYCAPVSSGDTSGWQAVMFHACVKTFCITRALSSAQILAALAKKTWKTLTGLKKKKSEMRHLLQNKQRRATFIVHLRIYCGWKKNKRHPARVNWFIRGLRAISVLACNVVFTNHSSIMFLHGWVFCLQLS